MSDIKITRQADNSELAKLGVANWPTWEKEVSVFPWTYDSSETCYFLAGEVIVTPEGGKPVSIGKGDLVTFPASMSCTWDIRQPVHKQYRLG